MWDPQASRHSTAVAEVVGQPLFPLRLGPRQQRVGGAGLASTFAFHMPDKSGLPFAARGSGPFRPMYFFLNRHERRVVTDDGVVAACEREVE